MVILLYYGMYVGRRYRCCRVDPRELLYVLVDSRAIKIWYIRVDSPILVYQYYDKCIHMKILC